MLHRFRDVPRLFRIERARRAFAYRAEATMTRANVAAKHERRRAIRPTFEDVWATRFLTDRVQVKTFNQLQYVILIGRIAQTNLQPVGFGLARFRSVADNA
jgi:hypothetical protein